MQVATGFGWARLAMLVAAFMCGSVLAVPAQTVPALPVAEEADEADDAPMANGNVDVLEGIDVDKLDWSQLAADASTLGEEVAAKKRAARQAAHDGPSWSSNANANGSSAVNVKQAISPFWDTRIGADMTLAREPATMSELLAQKAANGGQVPSSSGSAWAAASAPGAGAIWDKTAMEARLDPGAESSRLGASFSKSLPLSPDYALTLQHGYSLNQQGTTPIPGIAGHLSRSSAIEQQAKVTNADTGTSFTAGQTLSSSDDKWLRRFGAEQKIYDGLTVSGSVGETAQGTTSKSLSAGFKKSW